LRISPNRTPDILSQDRNPKPLHTPFCNWRKLFRL
jgi:hypothetical protein